MRHSATPYDSLALPDAAAHEAPWPLHLRSLTQRLQYWWVAAPSRCLLQLLKIAEVVLR